MIDTAFAEMAWYSFVCWAAGHAGMRAEYERDTGIKLAPARAPIEKLIDDATGARAAELSAFVLWVTKKHWGIRYAPKAYRDHVRKAGKR